MTVFVYVSTETRHGMIQAAKEEYVALLNAGLVPTKNDWLKELMNIGQQETSLFSGPAAKWIHAIAWKRWEYQLIQTKVHYFIPKQPPKVLAYYYSISFTKKYSSSN